MPTTVATDLENAFELTGPNIVGLYIPAGVQDIQARLQNWQTDFFGALDTTNPQQAEIYQWIAPTSALVQNMAKGFAVALSFDLNRIVLATDIVSRTIIAARFNGFVPPAPLDAALTAAFNNAWT